MTEKNKKILTNIIAGCLKTVILAHGPITLNNFSSVSKRATAQFCATFKDLDFEDNYLQLCLMELFVTLAHKKRKRRERITHSNNETEKVRLLARNLATNEVINEFKKLTVLLADETMSPR